MEEPAEEGAKLHQFLGASQNPKAADACQGWGLNVNICYTAPEHRNPNVAF